MNDERKRPLTVELTAEQRQQLRMLRSSPAVANQDAPLEEVVSYILSSVCDGIRRSGSWEHGVVLQLFGEFSYEPPPLCSVCEFDLLDEDDELEMEAKRCETCLIELIDEWECSFPEQPPGVDETGETVRVELCDRAFGGDADARRACWEAIKAQGFRGAGGGADVAPEASPVQCIGDAEPRRAASSAVPSADDSEG